MRERDARIVTLLEWLRNPGWAPKGADVVADDIAEIQSQLAALTTWTREAPTVPGEYRYRYRFEPDQEWTYSRMQVHEVPFMFDSSETQWCGPYPEPAEPRGRQQLSGTIEF